MYGEQELISLIWKNLKSSQMEAFLKSLPGKARVEKLGGDSPRWIPDRLVYFCEQAGINLDFSLKRYNYGILEEIEVFAEGVNGYTQYAGDLPYGLSFNDTLSDVERKIGKAEESGREKLICRAGYEYWASYRGLGVEVRYKSRKAPVHAPRNRTPRLRGFGFALIYFDRDY